jgi:hypothetical protein
LGLAGACGSHRRRKKVAIWKEFDDVDDAIAATGRLDGGEAAAASPSRKARRQVKLAGLTV